MKIHAVVAALLMTSSCAFEEILIATSDGPPDGGHPPPLHGCVTNVDCRPEEYCAKPNCLQPMGGCMRRPAVCPSDLAPMCGCDGITYFNDCWRKRTGIAASTPGECDNATMECGGSNPYVPCPPPLHCSQLLPESMSMCTPDIKGRCWLLPPQCDPNAPGDTQRWLACSGPGGPCLDTCSAIWANGPHFPAPQCP